MPSVVSTWPVVPRAQTHRHAAGIARDQIARRGDGRRRHGPRGNARREREHMPVRARRQSGRQARTAPPNEVTGGQHGIGEPWRRDPRGRARSSPSARAPSVPIASRLATPLAAPVMISPNVVMGLLKPSRRRRPDDVPVGIDRQQLIRRAARLPHRRARRIAHHQIAARGDRRGVRVGEQSTALHRGHLTRRATRQAHGHARRIPCDEIPGVVIGVGSCPDELVARRFRREHLTRRAHGEPHREARRIARR